MSEIPASGAAPSKLPSVAIGAAVYALLGIGLTFLTFRVGGAAMYASLCGLCLVMLLGPVLAVWHYTSTYRLTLLAGPGAAIGAMTGAAGALLSGVLTQALIAIQLLPDQAEQLAIQRANMIEMGMDPAQVNEAMAAAGTGPFSNPWLALVLSTVIAAALGAAIGAISASLFKKGDPV